MSDIMLVSSALFDMSYKYRFLLTRIWDTAKPSIAFVMLNPSTADAKTDDPTIRRCISFAKAWGYGGIEIVNLFALVSSDPAALLIEPNAVGNDNDKMILGIVGQAPRVIAAWGAFKEAKERAAAVTKLLEPYEVYCLGITKDGSPKHPLYIKSDTVPIRYIVKEKIAI